MNIDVKEIQKGSVNWNYDMLHKMIKEDLDKYRDLVVTEDNLKESKSDKKELAGLRNSLNKERIRIKKLLNEPIDVFNDQVKKLVGLIEDVEAPIKEGLDVYEEKRRESVKDKVRGIIETFQEVENLPEKYLARVEIRSEYLNVTQTDKKTKESIENDFKMLSMEWQKEESDVKTIETLCKTASSGITSEIKSDSYIERYRSGSAPLDVLSGEIMREAETRKEAERSVAAKAKEEAREEIQEEMKREEPVIKKPGISISIPESIEEEDEPEHSFEIRITCTIAKKDHFKMFLEDNNIKWERL